MGTSETNCAHREVLWTPLKCADGQHADHWGCRDCGATFVPAALLDRAMRCGYHLCTLVADNAVSRIDSPELRGVAYEKVREHVTKAFENMVMPIPGEDAAALDLARARFVAQDGAK